MGMFDEVIADFNCPYCSYTLTRDAMEKTVGKTDDTWQTKATSCILKVYRIGDELDFKSDIKIKEGWMEIHHVCLKCDKFVQADIDIKNEMLNGNIKYRNNEIVK